MATPINRLELRHIDIPRGPIVAMMEQVTGRSLPHELRHYLAGSPVYCGDFLEVYLDNQWITGRYEWTAILEDKPTLDLPGRVICLDDTLLLRWPD